MRSIEERGSQDGDSIKREVWLVALVVLLATVANLGFEKEARLLHRSFPMLSFPKRSTH